MIKLIVMDLDNTLYDWVSYFVPSFDAMVNSLVIDEGVDERRLLASLRRVHQTHRTTEYAFALAEIDLFHGIEATAASELRSHPSINAFRTEASKRLRPYPGVAEGIRELKRDGRVLVAYTDAMATYADTRLEELGLADSFDELVATQDHAIPEAAHDGLSWLPPARFRHHAVKRQTLVGMDERKPCPAPLERLLDEHGVHPHEAVYVGDSLTRDIPMAQAAGVHDVYAAYGRSYDASLWDRLVAVTHWTEADVEREQELAAHRAHPTRTIHEFGQLADVLVELDRLPMAVRP